MTDIYALAAVWIGLALAAALLAARKDAAELFVLTVARPPEMLGSVSKQVVQYAVHPVLVVR